MLIVQSAIDSELRTFLETDLSARFRFEEGRDLDVAIKEILSNRDIFSFLTIHLPERHGLRLGNVGYYDGERVYHNYGLTIGREVPRKTVLYSCESLGIECYYDDRAKQTMQFSDHLPRLDFTYVNGYPSPMEFCTKIKKSFIDFQRYLINFDL
ncbi:MAG: hypothetical protein RL557_858 [archaeon]|jgi:hypothetical protein